jgi:hypothetical protein
LSQFRVFWSRLVFYLRHKNLISALSWSLNLRLLLRFWSCVSYVMIIHNGRHVMSELTMNCYSNILLTVKSYHACNWLESLWQERFTHKNFSDFLTFLAFSSHRLLHRSSVNSSFLFEHSYIVSTFIHTSEFSMTSIFREN